MQSNDREATAHAVHGLPVTECASREALCFTHQGRIITLCMEFRDGCSAVDERKVQYVDSLKFTKAKIWILERIGTQETDIRYSITRKSAV